MKTERHYIMHEQVEDLIPSLMKRTPTIKPLSNEGRLHLVAVGVVTLIYLITTVTLS